jgi:hypothetical protein
MILWDFLIRKSYILALALMGIIFTACGFQPLYQQDSELRYELSKCIVEYAKKLDQDDKLFYLLQKAVKKELHLDDSPQPGRYKVVLELETHSEAAAIQSDSTVTRTDIILNLKYSLYEAATGKLLKMGVVKTVNSYNIGESHYSNFIASEETAFRAVRLIAYQLKAELLTYLLDAQ